MVSHRLDHVRHDGSVLTPAPGSTAYVEAPDCRKARRRRFCRRDPQVQVFGATGSPPPPGSEHIFNLDPSWFFAESAQAAVLQAVVGLV